MGNTDEITVNTADIMNNTAGIADNEANISNNTAEIAINTADIASNEADIAMNAAHVFNNTADIADNEANIAGNTAGIASNAADIATNTDDIASNDVDIATNLADIEQLKTDVANDIARLQQLLDSAIPAQEINGGTYRFIHTPKNWTDAQKFCESLGGNLFVPKNEADNDDVAAFASEQTAVWIGATDQQSEGTWVDPTGAALTFTHWYTHASQPDGAGDCAIMDTRTEFHEILGAWWDDDCSHERPSICEL